MREILALFPSWRLDKPVPLKGSGGGGCNRKGWTGWVACPAPLGTVPASQLPTRELSWNGRGERTMAREAVFSALLLLAIFLGLIPSPRMALPARAFDAFPPSQSQTPRTLC